MKQSDSGLAWQFPDWAEFQVQPRPLFQENRAGLARLHRDLGRAARLAGALRTDLASPRDNRLYYPVRIQG